VAGYSRNAKAQKYNFINNFIWLNEYESLLYILSLKKIFFYFSPCLSDVYVILFTWLDDDLINGWD